ncbi:hypothetical protein [Streptomyces sp. NPDC014622]|uniref:hypothetical protein n=1 Tax=Streptomyces sp. NPDC014622 TaxID=3364874 RepID=UPI0036FE2451
MNTMTPVKATPSTCPYCGQDVPQKPGPGRRKVYCTPDHRKLYVRNQRALWGWY